MVIWLRRVGDLLEYNPYSKKTSIVTSDLPSDPKDPKMKE